MSGNRVQHGIWLESCSVTNWPCDFKNTLPCLHNPQLLFFFFWLCCAACGILVPRSRIEPVPAALRVLTIRLPGKSFILFFSWLDPIRKAEFTLEVTHPIREKKSEETDCDEDETRNCPVRKAWNLQWGEKMTGSNRLHFKHLMGYYGKEQL